MPNQLQTADDETVYELLSSCLLNFREALLKNSSNNSEYKEISPLLRGHCYQPVYDLAQNNVITPKHQFDCLTVLIRDIWSMICHFPTLHGNKRPIGKKAGMYCMKDFGELRFEGSTLGQI